MKLFERIVLTFSIFFLSLGVIVGAPGFPGTVTVIPVPISEGGTNATTASSAATNLGVGTGDSPQFTAVNVGHASDTTITRASAGNISVEGNNIYRAGGTDVPVTDGGTGASSAGDARTSLGLVIGTDVQAYDADLGVLAGLADPNADRILFWDDSAGAYVYLSVGTGLTITGTEITSSGGGGLSFEIPCGGAGGANEGWTETTGTWAFTGAERLAWQGIQFINSGTAAVGDELTVQFKVPETGTYKVWVLAANSTDLCQFVTQVDGTTFGSTIDLYAASPVFNNWTGGGTTSSLTAGTSYNFSLEVTGKNASSTDELLAFQKVLFVKQ